MTEEVGWQYETLITPLPGLRQETLVVGQGRPETHIFYRNKVEGGGGHRASRPHSAQPIVSLNQGQETTEGEEGWQVVDRWSRGGRERTGSR